MKRLLIFDDNGFYIDEEIVHNGFIQEENHYLAEIDEDISFHIIKLVNGQLVEGRTEDELFEEQLISSLLPDAKELEKAEFEIKILTLLSEMEMF